MGRHRPDAFDCSGLIYAAYRSVGIFLPRTTFGMWDLRHTSPSQGQPGDIVFFNTGPGTAPDHPGHVGLVIGDGQMVVANCTTCGPITTASYAATRPSSASSAPSPTPSLTSHRPEAA